MGGRGSTGNRSNATSQLTSRDDWRYNNKLPAASSEMMQAYKYYDDYLTGRERTSKTEIDIDKITTKQNWVLKSTTDSLMTLSLEELRNVRDSGSRSKLPYVVKYKDEYMVTNGNHRILAMMLKGAKTVKVEVLDLEKLRRR